jgi:frataxin-like iron-binding protein CyaY
MAQFDIELHDNLLSIGFNDDSVKIINKKDESEQSFMTMKSDQKAKHILAGHGVTSSPFSGIIAS